jgi:hypothetical protein
MQLYRSHRTTVASLDILFAILMQFRILGIFKSMRYLNMKQLKMWYLLMGKKMMHNKNAD